MLTLCCWMLSGTLGWKSCEQGGMQLVLSGHGQCHKPCSLFAVFIYSMPGYKCSIKERMLYSSCKSRLLDTVEQEFCLEIAKKVSMSPLRYNIPMGPCCSLGPAPLGGSWVLQRWVSDPKAPADSAFPVAGQIEIDDGAELTAEFLYEEVHPKQHAFKQAFAKPKGPVGKRGHKRLIKGPGENGEDS